MHANAWTGGGGEKIKKIKENGRKKEKEKKKIACSRHEQTVLSLWR